MSKQTFKALTNANRKQNKEQINFVIRKSDELKKLRAKGEA